MSRAMMDSLRELQKNLGSKGRALNKSMMIKPRSSTSSMITNLGMGSMFAIIKFVVSLLQQYFRYQVQGILERYCQRVLYMVYPYVTITFNELMAERLSRTELYSAIESYLSSKSSAQAKRLKGELLKNNLSKVVLSADEYEEITDEFQGVKLWWVSGKTVADTPTLFAHNNEKRYYTLTFHKKHRDLVVGPYLSHILKEGQAIRVRNRQRKLYTNNGPHWRHVMLEHPATFEKLALEADRKKEILEDLITFSQAGEYYARIGRAWKRGYLLYGPPGTGKSTMIAAIANLLSYDIFDLELSSVKDNTELRKLLIETTSKSVIVIEDIDCSLDLTGQRKHQAEVAIQKPTREASEPKLSLVTLSGLLNCIDGLWSSCGGERLIIFTTNYVEKLDPALIRKGRMDKHIELSYCSFEAFKVLAKNYLLLDEHQLFDKIRQLLQQTKITPVDVAEHLMPKTHPPNPEACLYSLVLSLQAAAVNARPKAAAANSRPKAASVNARPATELQASTAVNVRPEAAAVNARPATELHQETAAVNVRPEEAAVNARPEEAEELHQEKENTICSKKRKGITDIEKTKEENKGSTGQKGTQIQTAQSGMTTQPILTGIPPDPTRSMQVIPALPGYGYGYYPVQNLMGRVGYALGQYPIQTVPVLIPAPKTM